MDIPYVLKKPEWVGERHDGQPPNLTDSTYAAFGAKICPSCQSKEVVRFGSPEVRRQECLVDMACILCSFSWKSKFELSGFRVGNPMPTQRSKGSGRNDGENSE